MQIVDNLTKLNGTLVARAPHPTRPGFESALLDVAQTEPVEGRADLLAGSAGTRLEVAFREGLLGNAAPGTGVEVRAARTSSGDVMAEPHPEPGTLRLVEPGPLP